ncbi:MAG: hypothetical protein ACLVCT_03025 [Lachnospira sp.]
MDNYRRAEHTTRPLTEEEKQFAEEHHDLMYRYMKIHELDPEEWYDILIIPYLNAVKKYHQYERLQSLKFKQVFFRTLDNARSNYWRDMNRKKRCPEGGLFSYDSLLDNGYEEKDFEFCLIDPYTNVERQVILKELYREFYRKCIEREAWANDIRKTELDMLIEGHTLKQILRTTLKMYGGCNDDGLYSWALDNDIERFRKIFKEVFGI